MLWSADTRERPHVFQFQSPYANVALRKCSRHMYAVRTNRAAFRRRPYTNLRCCGGKENPPPAVYLYPRRCRGTLDVKQQMTTPSMTIGIKSYCTITRPFYHHTVHRMYQFSAPRKSTTNLPATLSRTSRILVEFLPWSPDHLHPLARACSVMHHITPWTTRKAAAEFRKRQRVLFVFSMQAIAPHRTNKNRVRAPKKRANYIA